jgi:hypothetical protein
LERICDVLDCQPGDLLSYEKNSNWSILPLFKDNSWLYRQVMFRSIYYWYLNKVNLKSNSNLLFQYVHIIWSLQINV